jgi:RNA polymerase sigma-70 factor (ECF subfamily)
VFAEVDSTPDPRLSAITGGAPSSAEDLLLRIAEGEQTAFGGFYDLVAGKVFGVVRRVVRDPAQAEEVAQEVLVEAWRTAPLYDPGRGSATVWVLTMAHRRAVDRVRSEQASRVREERVTARDRTREFDEVSELVETRMESQLVKRALDHLTDVQREAIELAYYGGLTCREVAELLGAPVGTVKTRIRDGLIRLRDALGVTV